MKPETEAAVERLRHVLVTNDDQTLLLLFDRWQKLPELRRLHLSPHSSAAEIRRALLAAEPSHLMIFGELRTLKLVGGPLPGWTGSNHPQLLHQLATLCSLPEEEIEHMIAELEQAEARANEAERQRAKTRRERKEQAKQGRLEQQLLEQARQEALMQAESEGRARCRAGAVVTSAGGHELRFDAEARRFSCGRCQGSWGRMPRWATVCPGPPLGELCTKTALTRDYQLTKRWIERLGPPDRIRRWHRDYYTVDLHLYEIARVERFIEQHREEYDAYLEARKKHKRQQAPLPAQEGEGLG